MFNSYLASKSTDSFSRHEQLCPSELDALRDRLAGSLSHVGSRRAPISSRYRLCLLLRLVHIIFAIFAHFSVECCAVPLNFRFISHGTLYSHMSGEYAMKVSTMCTISQEVAKAITECECKTNHCVIQVNSTSIIVSELHDFAFPTPTAQTLATSVKESAEFGITRQQWKP